MEYFNDFEDGLDCPLLDLGGGDVVAMYACSREDTFC